MKRKIDITKLASFAHLGKEGVKHSLEPLGYTLIDFFDTSEDLQGYVAECDTKQVIVFRESEDIINHPQDWINNFKVKSKKFEGKEYHGGYLDLILDNFDVICDKLTDINVVIGGFSQGGGLAEVLANVLNDTTGFNPWFANVDGPAVIKDNGYTNGIYTINSNDPVPISTLPIGYKHFGDLVYFTFRGKTYINPKKIIRKIDFLIETAEDVFELAQGKIDFEHNIMEINKNWWNGLNKIEKIL